MSECFLLNDTGVSLNSNYIVFPSSIIASSYIPFFWPVFQLALFFSNIIFYNDFCSYVCVCVCAHATFFSFLIDASSERSGFI